MKITVQSSKIVKPVYSGGAPPAGVVVPLTVLDKVNYDGHIGNVYLFHPPAPPNSALATGLATALAAHREWAGRFCSVDADDGAKRGILLNDAGVRFVEATADVALGSIKPHDPTPELLRLRPSGGAEELMQVQATRFACGSLAVGTATHHVVAVGNNSRAVVTNRVRFSQAMITELKSRAGGGGGPYRYSTIQCVVAHLWRCITKARGLDADALTKLRIAVNGRPRMRHPPPHGLNEYTGNVVLWAQPTAMAGELVARPLQWAAELVSRAVHGIDDCYFRSFIDFASSGAVEKEGLVPTDGPAKTVHSPDIFVSNLKGIPVYDCDFGAGRPFLFTRSYPPEEGMVFIMPPFSGDGSMHVQVALFGPALEIFKDCCYSWNQQAQNFRCLPFITDDLLVLVNLVLRQKLIAALFGATT